MTSDVALILLQDGIVSGAVYVLLATVLVLVFSVTRVIFVPQGDLVAFTALTLSACETGNVPGRVWLLVLGAAAALLLESREAAAQRDRTRSARSLLHFGAFPALIALVAVFLVPKPAPLPWKMAVSCALITCLGPITYRIVFQPLAESSPLVLLIAAIATHLGLNTSGLHFFGPVPVRTACSSTQLFSRFGLI